MIILLFCVFPHIELAKECSRGYENRAHMCVKENEGKKIWRGAIEACNYKDGTLAFVDTVEKIDELKKIIQTNGYGKLPVTNETFGLWY